MDQVAAADDRAGDSRGDGLGRDADDAALDRGWTADGRDVHDPSEIAEAPLEHEGEEQIAVIGDVEGAVVGDRGTHRGSS